MNATRRNKNKKMRGSKILVAPFLAVVFLIGWILYLLGERNDNKLQKTKNSPMPRDNVQLMMIPQEEQTIKSS